MIIPVAFLIILIGGGVWSIYKAFTSGDVEYGYKYYPPKYISNRKNDPAGFWFAILLYLLSILGCIFFMIYIWTH